MIKTAILCLAMNVFYEARSEPVIVQKAVAHVVLNRVKQDGYPNDVCKVVYQKGQFSWVSKTTLRAPPKVSFEKDPIEFEAWQQALLIASRALRRREPDITGGATHFHRVDKRPKWRRELRKIGQFGKHIFYKSH
jgi:N-acetylmuramoyl-L-alanine amidase